MPIKVVPSFLMNVFILLILLPAAKAQPKPSFHQYFPIDATPLPVHYASHRFYVAPVTTQGDTLLFYTDTGGGANMLWHHAAERLGWKTAWLPSGGDSVRIVSLPPLNPNAAIPLPNLLPPFGQRLLVTKPSHTGSFASSGFLGRTWFAGRVWAFDYPSQSLSLVTGYDPDRMPAQHRVELGFQTDSSGRRTTHFPRIQIEIDGASLDLLFDTGATIVLTDSARIQLNDGGPAERGTCFIAESVFTRWRERHPEWRIVEHADRQLDMPMIEVPAVTVGGYTVGPVWFTMRPDPNFHEYMSQWMDRRIEGALGGSALQYFRVIVDYPTATAIFERR